MREQCLSPPRHGTAELFDESGDALLFVDSRPQQKRDDNDDGGRQEYDSDSLPAKLGPVDFELGIIAGTGTINIFASTMLPDPDDGKVSVASTRVEGMDDFLVVGNSHRYIIKNELVYRNTVAFLRSGAFLADDKAEMLKP